MKKILCLLMSAIMFVALGACSKEKESTGNNPPEKNFVIDKVAIKASYEYKIVLRGTQVTFPTFEFSQNDLSISYYLDGEKLGNVNSFEAKEVGTNVLEVKAINPDGYSAVKNIVYTVTEDENDLNTMYDFETVNGLQMHVGTARNGLNNLRLTLVDYVVAPDVDVYGNEIPAIVDGQKVINEYTTMQNATEFGRITLTNPLHVNPQEKFSQLYFYFYNGGQKDITVNFNNYSQTIKAKSGWQKVIIAPKEVEKTVNGETLTVIETDYTKITSLGNSITLDGMIDPEDMVGTFLRIDATLRHERMAISSIYGLPKN